MPLSPTEAAETLKRWQEEEAAVRAHLSREVGSVQLSELANRTGMQVFEGIFSGEFPAVPIGRTLDFVAIHVEPGVAIFQGKPSRAHYNPLGSVHGGWFATLLDSCVGCAVHSTLPAGKLYTTVELKVNMIKALTDKVPLVRAEGKVINVGRSVGIAEGRLVGPDGTLYAHATTTCFIFDAPGAKGQTV